MRRRFFSVRPFLLLLASLIADTVLLPMVSQHWLLPTFTLISVISFGLLFNRSAGVWYGLIGGIIMDVSVNAAVGQWTLACALYGFVGGVIGDRMQQMGWRELMPGISGAVCRLAFEIVMLIYVFLVSIQFDVALLPQLLARVALEAVLVSVFYRFYNRLLKPVRSRYARRRA